MVGHRLQKLVDIIEKFAHRDRYVRALSEFFPPTLVLRGQGIFDKERAEFLQFVDHIDGLGRLYTFMYVVQKLHIITALFTYRFEHFGYGPEIYLWIHVIILFVSVSGRLEIRGLLVGTHGTVTSLLYPDVPISFVYKFLYIFCHGFGSPAPRMGITGNRKTGLSPCNLVSGIFGGLPFMV